MSADGEQGGVIQAARLREYVLMRCDQNERVGSTKVRIEISVLRTALAKHPTSPEDAA